MIIIYILAAIGGFAVIGMTGLVIILIISGTRYHEAWTEPVCILTNEPCPNTDASTGSCEGCPIVEEFIGTQKGEQCQ